MVGDEADMRLTRFSIGGMWLVNGNARTATCLQVPDMVEGIAGEEKRVSDEKVKCLRSSLSGSTTLCDCSMVLFVQVSRSLATKRTTFNAFHLYKMLE